ncbi:hypothetical protein WG66_005774 [Moniliophthora roreri]|nr:hypothetical protein WG66_005774 [Moniliophthora roreri]
MAAEAGKSISSEFVATTINPAVPEAELALESIHSRTFPNMDREMSHEEIHIWSWALVVIIGDQEGLSKLSSKKLVELVIQTRSFYGPVGFDLLPGIVWNFISTLTNLRSLSVGPFHRTSDGEQIFAVRSRLEHSQELCLSYNFGEGIHPTTDPSNFYPHSHPSEPSSHSPSGIGHATNLRYTTESLTCVDGSNTSCPSARRNI